MRASRHTAPHFLNPLRRAALLCVAVACVCVPWRAAAQTRPNRAAAQSVQVYVSSAPNPAWTPVQAVDGLLDVNHGWIASSDSGAEPWIALEFPEPVLVETIVFYQAGLTEAGENRFARPKQLRLEMDGVEPRTVTLEDRERVPQRLAIDPVRTSVVKIDVLSTYGDARFPFLTGFQEIEIYEGALNVDGAREVANSAPASAGQKPSPDPVIEEVEDTVLKAARVIQDGPPASGGGELTAEERELLMLLREFTERLEEYMKNN